MTLYSQDSIMFDVLQWTVYLLLSVLATRMWAQADDCVTEGDIRLVDGNHQLEGRLEVCLYQVENGRLVWGNVCNIGWDQLDTAVSCRQLGVSEQNLTQAVFGPLFVRRSPDSVPIHWTNTSCSGDETNLVNCSKILGSCSHDTIGLICGQPNPECMQGDVRIVNIAGNTLLAGRVEFCLGGRWGSVCNGSAWDDIDAAVVCRQLGIHGDFVPRAIPALPAADNVPISLGSLHCDQTNTRLEQCSKPEYVEQCTHEEDVGVICIQTTGAVPVDLVVTNNVHTSSQLLITWTLPPQVPQPDFFNISWIRVGTPIANTSVMLYNGSELTHNSTQGVTLSNLEAGETYKITVIAIHSTSPFVFNSSTIYGSTLPAGTEPPPLFSVNPTPGSPVNPITPVDNITLSWPRPNDYIPFISCYNLTWTFVAFNNPSERQAEMLITVPANSTHFHIHNYSGGAQYMFNVDVEIRPPGSDAIIVPVVRGSTFTAPDRPPSAPSNIIANPGTRNLFRSLDISWDLPSMPNGQLESCTIKIIGMNEQLLHRGEALEPPTNFLLTGRAPGTINTFELYCTNSFNGARAIGSGTTLLGVAPPSIGLGFIDSAKLTITVHLQFSDESGPYTRFLVVVSTMPFPDTTIADNHLEPYPGVNGYYVTAGAQTNASTIELVIGNGTTNRGYTNQPLESGVNYYFFVRLYNDDADKFADSDSIGPAMIPGLAYIIGISLGVLVPVAIVLIIVLLIIFFLVRKKRKEATNTLTSFEVVDCLPERIRSSEEVVPGILPDCQVVENNEMITDNSVEEVSSAISNAWSQIACRVIKQLPDIPDSLKIPGSCLKMSTTPIGQGETGIVFKGVLMEWRNVSMQEVAVKTLKGLFSSSDYQFLLNEIIKMKDFHHPHIMPLIGVCLDAGPGVSMVMPYMANGSLLDYLKRERHVLKLPEDHERQDQVLAVRKLLLQLCHQIALGMAYLIEQKFVHRDLAARNCMLDSGGKIKVGDFGLSEDTYCTGYFRQKGNADVKLPFKWMAIESLQDAIFSETTDVWSYGVTVWEVFSGGLIPYPGMDIVNLVKFLESGQRLQTPVNAACTDEIFAVMESCWLSTAKDRPTFNELSTIMGHMNASVADYTHKRINIAGKDQENNTDYEGYDDLAKVLKERIMRN